MNWVQNELRVAEWRLVIHQVGHSAYTILAPGTQFAQRLNICPIKFVQISKLSRDFYNESYSKIAIPFFLEYIGAKLIPF